MKHEQKALRPNRIDPTKQIVTKTYIKMPNGKSFGIVTKIIELDHNYPEHTALSNAVEVLMESQDAYERAMMDKRRAEMSVCDILNTIITQNGR